MMNPKRKQRLFFIISFIIGSSLIIGLVLYALRQNINVFYTPTDIISGKIQQKKRFRVGGLVQIGSLVKNKKNLEIQFVLTDKKHDITIRYSGILPDLFREGQGIIATGRFNQERKIFNAEQILAKHDANYMPPEVKAALEQNQRKKHYDS